MTVASLLSHLLFGCGAFYKINEKKNVKEINNDLAVVASQVPAEAVYDTQALCQYTNLLLLLWLQILEE